MEANIEKTVSALRARHINAIPVEDYHDANQKILDLIPLGKTVGAGDSTTMRQLGVLKALAERGTRILNPFESKAEHMDAQAYASWRVKMRTEASFCDVFLTGTNAITEDGRLVNVDATGNRVAGMFWGHPLSILVVGRNKIVKDLDEAFHRIRNIIAPTHFRVRSAELGGRTRGTPCVATGECNDCRSEGRGCNVFTIIEGKPSVTDVTVILINRDLGLSWDPSWPRQRIADIREHYKKFVWVSR